jgi:hypothetical protein
MHDWLLGYGIAFVGMIGEIVAMAFMANGTINHIRANQMMSKLLQSDNLSRALKLCRAAGKATYLKSVEAAIVAGTSAGTKDRAVLTPAVTTAFDADAGPRSARYKRMMFLGIAAAIMTLAGCGLVVTLPPHQWGTPLGIGVCAIFVGAGFVMRVGKFNAAIRDTRHHLLPSIVEALATGTAAI